MMKPINPEQLIALNTVIHKKGLMQHKADMVEGATNGRTRSSKDLYFDEARELIMALNSYAEAKNKDDKGPMVRKLFRMAHEIGWIKKQSIVNSQQSTAGPLIAEKNDYSRVYGWVLKYGYLKKDLRRYAYKEMPKLLSQFEFGPYKSYISNLNK